MNTPGSSPSTRAGHLPGYYYVLIAAVLWGTTGTAQAFAPPGAQPATIGALRLLVGGCALLVYALARRRFTLLSPWPIKTAIVTGIFIALYQLCFFYAVARTGVALGTIVGIGSSPIFGGILGAVFRKEKVGLSWAAATVLAIAGCILMVGVKGSSSADLPGIFLAAGAGFSYAAFTLTSKKMIQVQPPEAVAGITFSIGAIILLPLLFSSDLGWVADPRGLLVILHLGLVATGLSYFLFTRGLKTIDVSRATTLSLAEPLTAGLLGMVILGEKLTPVTLFGAVLLLGGLLIINLFD